MGHEPYWRTNTSFSPPPPRWDYRFQSEGIQYSSADSMQLFGSTSSDSKESRSWMRGGYCPPYVYSTSEGGALYFSSPSDASLVQPWTPPPMQGINIDEYEISIKRGTCLLLDGEGGQMYSALACNGNYVSLPLDPIRRAQTAEWFAALEQMDKGQFLTIDIFSDHASLKII